MVSKLRKPVPDRDQVVIIEEGTADIATVFDIDDRAVYAESSSQEYAIPIGDLKPYVGSSGRIFVLNADADYISDTKRLAELEKSIVLRQVTHYQKPPSEEPTSINIRAILLYVLIGILLLAVIFK
ncbi:hypothetical protein [Paenibacillus sp. GCM10027626]|uniref:hypothetical protein n=1 Tax=Paenibacillus sp. GCM10027626 TaxID=3273411 RepID=UPI003643C284